MIFFLEKSFTEEEDNYLRVCLLLFNIGTKAVYYTFDKCLSEIKVDEDGNLDKWKKIFIQNQDILKDSRFITKSQLDLLFPRSGGNALVIYQVSTTNILMFPMSTIFTNIRLH